MTQQFVHKNAMYVWKHSLAEDVVVCVCVHAFVLRMSDKKWGLKKLSLRDYAAIRRQIGSLAAYPYLKPLMNTAIQNGCYF